MRSRILPMLCAIALPVAAQQPSTPDDVHDAIRRDDLAAMQSLVRQHGVEVLDRQGSTPLMTAAVFGSVDAVRMLLDGGATVTATSRSGATPLHLATHDARKVRLLLDRGAPVDARSNIGRTPLIVAASTHGSVEAVTLLLGKDAAIDAADNTGVTPLIAAASVDDRAVVRLLLDRGANARAVAAGVPQAATPLMGAAFNGNADLVRRLLATNPEVRVRSAEQGAAVKNGRVQFGSVTALHMAVSGGNSDAVRMLLEAGADVDTADHRGMTPLMWALGTDRPNPRIVTLLLNRGADVTLRSTDKETAADWARKFNHPDVMRALALPVSPPAAGGPGDLLDESARRQAIDRGLPLLRQASDNMLPRGGCVACHAQPVAALAAQRARPQHAAVPASDIQAALAEMQARAPQLVEGREIGGMPDAQLYMTLMLAAYGVPSSAGTDAFVSYLAAKQRQAGYWYGIGATRAPMQDGNFSRTALAIRALTAYPIPARRAELAQRVTRAAAWLVREKPITTEDRVMQLLGLKWANAHPGERLARTRELLALQRADGGWGQTPHLASDAYATGQAVVVLHEMGTPAPHPALQRAAAFLVHMQQADGSWHVRSRAMKIQPYFESGFPHGHDQWISQAASAWATIALGVTTREADAGP